MNRGILNKLSPFKWSPLILLAIALQQCETKPKRYRDLVVEQENSRKILLDAISHSSSIKLSQHASVLVIDGVDRGYEDGRFVIPKSLALSSSGVRELRDIVDRCQCIEDRNFILKPPASPCWTIQFVSKIDPEPLEIHFDFETGQTFTTPNRRGDICLTQESIRQLEALFIAQGFLTRTPTAKVTNEPSDSSSP